MATENQWKDKYLNALEASEATESRLKAAEDTLRLTVSRLTLAASGSDQQLDEQLEKLKTLTKRSPDNGAIRSLLEQISVSLKRLDIELNAGRPQRLPPHLFLAALTKKIEFPDVTRKKVKALDKKLSKKQASAQLDEHLAEFLSLVNESIQPSLEASNKAPSEDKEEARPDTRSSTSAQALVEELFLQLRDQFSGEDSLHTICSQLDSASTGKELEKAVSRLLKLVQTDNSSKSISSSADRSIEQSSIGSSPQARFIEFLDMLSLPDNLVEKATLIKRQLNGDLVATDWPPLLSSIADIVAKMRSEAEKERSELQEFLYHITAQLQSIDTTLINTEEHQHASFSSGKELDEAVRFNLTELKTSVESEPDLSNLRQIIDQRMEKINAHLQEYRDTETQRQEELTTEMRALRSRLKNMESETTELNEKLAAEREQARTDLLTGINNRVAYEQRLDEEYKRWQKGKTGLSTIVCDVDRFKALNDNLGHQAGDKALQSIAKVLQQNIRKGDLLARYGGEEFVVLISHELSAGRETAQKIAEKLRSEVENADFQSKGERIPITISCGYSSFRGGDSKEEPFSRADKALYRAKELGRNRVERE